MLKNFNRVMCTHNKLQSNPTRTNWIDTIIAICISNTQLSRNLFLLFLCLKLNGGAVKMSNKFPLESISPSCSGFH